MMWNLYREARAGVPVDAMIWKQLTCFEASNLAEARDTPSQARAEIDKLYGWLDTHPEIPDDGYGERLAIENRRANIEQNKRAMEWLRGLMTRLEGLPLPKECESTRVRLLREASEDLAHFDSLIAREIAILADLERAYASGEWKNRTLFGYAQRMTQQSIGHYEGRLADGFYEKLAPIVFGKPAP